ncbi:MAG: hypothetical protein AAF236_06330, partial [Verrucomicrobiota bacterium]
MNPNSLPDDASPDDCFVDALLNQHAFAKRADDELVDSILGSTIGTNRVSSPAPSAVRVVPAPRARPAADWRTWALSAAAVVTAFAGIGFLMSQMPASDTPLADRPADEIQLMVTYLDPPAAPAISPQPAPKALPQAPADFRGQVQLVSRITPTGEADLKQFPDLARVEALPEAVPSIDPAKRPA